MFPGSCLLNHSASSPERNGPSVNARVQNPSENSHGRKIHNGPPPTPPAAPKKTWCMANFRKRDAWCTLTARNLKHELSHSLQGKLASGGRHVAPRPACSYLLLTGVSFSGKIHVSFRNKLTPQEEGRSSAKLSGPLEYLREETLASVGVGLRPRAPAIAVACYWGGSSARGVGDTCGVSLTVTALFFDTVVSISIVEQQHWGFTSFCQCCFCQCCTAQRNTPGSPGLKARLTTLTVSAHALSPPGLVQQLHNVNMDLLKV